MKFDPKSAGNKGIPEPREGYEQRKVNYRNYHNAISKGFSPRLIGKMQVSGHDWILCERAIVDYIPKIVRIDTTSIPYIEPDDTGVRAPNENPDIDGLIIVDDPHLAQATPIIKSQWIKDAQKKQFDDASTDAWYQANIPLPEGALVMGGKVILKDITIDRYEKMTAKKTRKPKK